MESWYFISLTIHFFYKGHSVINEAKYLGFYLSVTFVKVSEAIFRIYHVGL